MNEPKTLSWVRDKKGKVLYRHPVNICNTITTFSAGGGTTAIYVMEPTICAMRGRGENNTQQLELRGGQILRMYRTEEQKALRRASNWANEKFSKGRERRPATDGVSNALTTVQKDNLLILPTMEEQEKPMTLLEAVQQGKYRIRKLTPRECFRLMDVSDEDIDKIQDAGISKTQQYKMAGNSIVVNVLYEIFRKMFVDKGQDIQRGTQLTLFDL